MGTVGDGSGTVQGVKSRTGTTTRKPILIKRGNVTVKIYSGTNRANGAAHDQFTLVFYEGGVRKKKNFGCATCVGFCAPARMPARNPSARLATGMACWLVR